MSNKITVAYMRDLEKQVKAEEISYSRMVELLNERLGHAPGLVRAVKLLKSTHLYKQEFTGTDVDEILTKELNKNEGN